MRITVIISDYSTIQYGNDEVSFITRRARALFFYMVIKKTASRDVLTDMFWPGVPPESGRKSLRTTLHYIRKAFNGESVFESRRDVLALGGDLEIETRYEGGDMFKDLFIEGCPEFNSFLYDYKSGFELANYDGLKQKFNQKIAGCSEKEAVVMFQALKERDPYDESLYAALMNYYNAHGRYRKSACAYKEIAGLLRDELSVEPGAELTALYKNTLARLSKKADGARNSWVPRGPELERLKLSFKNFLEGREFSSFIISAPMGTGKSALLSRFLSETGGECLVIRVTCYEAEKDSPYRVLNQIACEVIDRIQKDKQPLADKTCSSLQFLMKYFSFENQGRAVDRIDALDPLSYRHFVENNRQLFATALERYKIVLCIDDVQYMDAVSMDFLRGSIESYSGGSLFFLFAISTEHSADFSKIHYGLMKNRRVEVIRLENFSKAEIEAVIRSRCPEIRCGAETIFAETNGNPLLLFEYLNSAGQDRELYASTLSVLLNNKMRNLKAEQRQVLTLASFFIRRINHAVIAGLLRKSAAEIPEILDVLVTCGFIEEYIDGDDICFRFQCESFRKCIYDKQSALARESTHNMIAQYMETVCDGSEGDGDEILYHYQQAGNRAMYLKHQIRKLSSLINLDVEFPEFISDVSAGYIDEIEKEISIGNVPNDVKYEFYLMKGSFEIKTCDYAAGIRNIKRILEYDSDAARQIKAHKQMVYYAYQLRRPKTMYPGITAALSLIKNYGLEEERADVLKLFAMYSILAGELENASSLLEQSYNLFRSRKLCDHTLYNIACILNYQASVEKYQANYPATLKYYVKAISICEENGVMNGLSVFYTNMGQVLYKLGRQERSKEYFLKSENLYHSIHTNWSRALTESYLALILFNEGNYRESAAYLSQSLALADKLKNVYESTYNYCVARIIRRELPRSAEAARCYEKVLERDFDYYDQKAEAGFRIMNINDPALRLL
ncbi:AAA family ATPase [Cloacibacillus evryensis]|uniref:AAA family ATPase n=1 Tax=Cloacibacillus evryensis TaxID=508460 RepID=UPI00241D8867|nr:AAA family ATPase [Cloacibacillus evryensis]